MGSSVPAWRTDAQDELVRRAKSELDAAATSHALKTTDGFDESETATFLLDKLNGDGVTKAEQTWILWTLGRLSLNSYVVDARFIGLAFQTEADENTRIQSLRILAFRQRSRPQADETSKEQPEPSEGHRKVIRSMLKSENARLRHEMVQALWQMNGRQSTNELLDLAARETDRVTFYSTWNALRELVPLDQRKLWLTDKRAGVRLAALLGLFEDDAIQVDEVLPLRSDKDERVAGLVELWLQKTGGAEPLVTPEPAPRGVHRTCVGNTDNFYSASDSELHD